MINKPKLSEQIFIDKSEIINRKIILEDFKYFEHPKFGRGIEIYFKFPNEKEINKISSFSKALMSNFEGINPKECKGDIVYLKYKNKQYYFESEE